MKKFFKELNPFNNYEGDNKIIYTIKILLKTLITYFIGLELAGIVLMIIAIIFGMDPSFQNLSFNKMLLFKYYGYIIVILLFMLLNKLSKMKLDEIGFNKNIKTFLNGLLYGSISLFLIILILSLIKEINFVGLNKNINYLEFILFIGAWLIQATFEEIICRGYLFNKLKNKLPIILAIIINFLFFFIGHVYKLFNDGVILGLIGCINILLPSIIWSIMVLKYKNIYGAIGFHFIWNFINYNILGINLSGLSSSNSLLIFKAKDSFLTGMSYGIESSIITTIILLIILFIITKNFKIKDNS